MMLRLEGYRFGRLVIDGNEETRDVILLPVPERVVTNWWRADGQTRSGRPQGRP